MSERPKRGGLAAGAARGLGRRGERASAALDADHEFETVAVLEGVGVACLGVVDDDHHGFGVGFVEALGEEDFARGESGAPFDDGLRLLGAGALDEGGEPGDGDGHGAKGSGGIVKSDIAIRWEDVGLLYDATAETWKGRTYCLVKLTRRKGIVVVTAGPGWACSGLTTT